MSRYDGLIIPRSYSEYINKTDAASLLQALQLSGVMDAAPTANSNHPVKSSGLVPVDTVTSGNMRSVTSNAVYRALQPATKEINTGIKWINGRDIYRRVYMCTASGRLESSSWTLLNQYFNGLSDLASIIGDLINVKFSNGTLCMNAQWIERYGNDFEIYPLITRDVVYAQEFLIFEYTKASTRDLETREELTR